MNINQLFLVINIAIITSAINILPVIIGFARTLPGQIYMATGHYYLDYFVYLQSVSQGIRGNFLFANQFATDDPGKTILVWWPYLAIGRIAHFFHLSPIVVYWLSVFILVFFFVILIYILISHLLDKESFLMKITALIFSLISSAFLYFYQDSGSLHVIPIDFWYAPSSLFKRFEAVPHHLLGNVLILIIILISGKTLKKLKHFSKLEFIKQFIITGLLVIITMTFYPYQVIILMIALISTFIMTDIKSVKNWIFNGLMIVFVGGFGLLIKSLSLKSDLISRLNQSDINLSYYPTLRNIFETIGPIIIFSFLGIKNYLKNISPIRLIFINFIFISWILTFSYFASLVNNFNLRFLTTLSSIFLATLGVLGIKKIPNHIFRSIVTIILLAYFGYVSFLSFLPLLSNQNLFSPITYLPKGIIKGFEFLDTEPNNQAVLTSPSQLLGTVLPIFADRKVYIARHVFTPDYINKADVVNRIYLGFINEHEAKYFFTKNNIGYVILTSIESYSVDSLLKYKFLKIIYKNNDVVILKFLIDRP